MGLINAADSYNKKNAVNDPLFSRIISDPLTGKYFDASEVREAKAIKKAEAEAQSKKQADFYDSLKTEPDYAEKTKAVTDGRYGDLYNYINDIGGTRDKVYDDVGAENNGLAVYEYLSPEEVGTYNYLCATQGRSEAEKYLGSLQNTLNQRLGKYIASQFEGDTAMQVLYGLTSGADRLVSENLSSLTGEDYKSAAAYAKDLIRQSLKDTGGDINGSSLAQIAYDVADQFGYELPYTVLTIITGEVLAEAGIASIKFTRLLWSGGDDIEFGKKAAAYAAKNGMKTLEQTATGKLLDITSNVAKRILGDAKGREFVKPLWDKASAKFVQEADGTIHALLNYKGINESSTFLRVEYELAKELGIKIIFHWKEV